jgi:hypothetical protein
MRGFMLALSSRRIDVTAANSQAGSFLVTGEPARYRDVNAVALVERQLL